MTGRSAVREWLRKAEVNSKPFVPATSMSGDDNVEGLIGLQERYCFLRRGDRRDGVTVGLEHRRKHVAEEGNIVDQEHAARGHLRSARLPFGPVIEGQLQEVRNVDYFSSLPFDHRRSEQARPLAGQRNIQLALAP